MIQSGAMNLDTKVACLHTLIRDLDSVAVAFSGGVDSTYLLAACCDVLGSDAVLAVTASSPTLPGEELEAARRLALLIGVRLEVVETQELDNPDYVRNGLNRCFYCKDDVFEHIEGVAREYRLAAVVYGATVDDVGDYRPGMIAAREHGVHAPLLEAGLVKDDVRVLSRRRGLPTWDKPSMACLASRIPYGRPITVEVLGQVGQAEAFLRREIGLRQVRVRHHGQVARLEVEPDDFARLLEVDVRGRVVARLRSIGFRYVTLDLAGFRSGSMNEL